MDIGFPGLGAAPEFGMMKRGAIWQGTAEAVGRVFVRGFSCANHRARRVR